MLHVPSPTFQGQLIKWSSTQEFRVDLAGLVKTNRLGFSTLEDSSLIRLKMVNFVNTIIFLHLKSPELSSVLKLARFIKWTHYGILFICTVWVVKIYTEPFL